jgi:porin
MRALAATAMVCLVGCPKSAGAAETGAPGAARPNDALLLDNFGRLVSGSTNEIIHPTLLPPGGMARQLPTPTPGASTPPEIQERQQAARPASQETEWFPSVPPRLMPYLASQDEFGNTAAHHGALISVMPVEPLVQGAKYKLSDVGLRYDLKQTFTWANLTDVMKGDNNLGFYTFDFQGKWAVYDSHASGTAGWISTQIEAKSGLGAAGQKQDARHNLGSVTDPTGIWSSVDGLRIPELAWQQSLRDGELVLVAGMVSQGNYLDSNAYAGTGRGQFINSALIDTQVVPLPNYNFGLNISWQPSEQWYGTIGTSVGNGHAGFVPWTDFSWNNWSLLGEFGYLSSDLLGLGPGVYRVQPFVGQAEGASVQPGLGFNLQQQLGKDSPFGWFGRFGVGGGERLSHGAEQIGTGSQIGTGFVMQAPLQYLGVVPRLNNDLAGTGFVWSHSHESTQPIYHADEYVFETFYTLQLTPLLRVQPDFQVVWNSTHNPNSGASLVTQLQLILAW